MKLMHHLGAVLLIAWFCAAHHSYAQEQGLRAQSRPTRLTSPASFESPTAVVKELRFLANAMLDNYEKIRTWQGRYDFQDKQQFSESDTTKFLTDHKLDLNPSNGPFMWNASGYFAFAIDEENRLWVTDNVERSSVQSVSSGKSADVSGKLHQVSVLTNEDLLTFEPEITYRESMHIPSSATFPKAGRMGFRDFAKKGEHQSFGILLNPRDLFRCTPKYFWEECFRLAGWIEHPESLPGFDPKSVTLEKRTNDVGRVTHELLVVLPLKLGDPSTNMKFRYTFAEDSSYNLVRFELETADGRLNEAYSVDYVLDDTGTAFIPSKVSKLLPTTDGKMIRFQRILTLREARLNEPVSLDRFSFAALGLTDGDRFIDRVEQAGFVVDGNRLTQRVPFQEMTELLSGTTSTDSQRTSVSILLIVINAVVVTLLAVLALRKWRGAAQ